MAYRLVTGPETMVSYFKKVLNIDENKIILLYNDIDLPSTNTSYEAHDKAFYKSQLKVNKDSEVVLFVGRVSPLKGGHNIIPLAEKLLVHRPGAKLLIVGQLDHLPEVPKRAQGLGLPNVQFCGPVANRELSRYFLAADVFILPSESEGFPRVLLEAMGYGVPVVAFDVGGVRDILHPGQLPFLLPRGDIAGMVQQVTRLLADPALRTRQAELGRCKVRRYATPAVARMFVERIVLE
jgi:glycosyltransferase involved in cell wall biosynthesis